MSERDDNATYWSKRKKKEATTNGRMYCYARERLAATKPGTLDHRIWQHISRELGKLISEGGSK